MTIGFHEANNNTRNIYDDIREWKTGAWGWMHGGDFLEQNADSNNGTFGNISSESFQRRLDAGFTPYHALIDTNPHDIPNILELYKSDRFNPYAGNQYSWNDKEIAKGSIADVLYGLTKDRNQTKRMDVYNALRGYQGDVAQDRMSPADVEPSGPWRYIRQLRNDNPNDPLGGANPLLSGGGTSPVSGIQWQGTNMLSGDTSNVGEAPASTGKGFLGSYRANRKAELEASRPSVRSLFKEMEDYENE